MSQGLFSTLIGATALLCACSSAPGHAQEQQRIRYVAPIERGTGDGLSIANASGDLPYAIERALAGPDISELILLPGRYVLTETIVLKPARGPLVIRSLETGAATLDGSSNVGTALWINGRNLTISGLRFQSFKDNGVVIIGSDHILIQDNEFSNVTSSAWSQAAIHGLHYLSDIRIEGNTIRDTGYSAILFEAGQDGRLRDVAIKNNLISRTCLSVPDCGAIYAQGRAKDVGGFVISGNRIRDFGPPGQQAQAIYLDDWLSDVVVSGNRISGTGSFVFHIHGGSRNRVIGNTVDACTADGVIFYQDIDSEMHNNLIRDNMVRVPHARRDAAVKLDLRKSGAIGLGGNKIAYCSR